MKLHTKLFISFFMFFGAMLNAALSTQLEEKIKRNGLHTEELDARTNIYTQAYQNMQRLYQPQSTQLIIADNQNPATLTNPQGTITVGSGGVVYVLGAQNLSMNIENGGQGIVGTAHLKNSNENITQAITVQQGATLINGAYNAASNLQKEFIFPQFKKQESLLSRIKRQSIAKLANKLDILKK